jgi:chemotaxis protein CheZ
MRPVGFRTSPDSASPRWSRTLKTIEAKVTYIVTTFGRGDAGEAAGSPVEVGEAGLLNGPQHSAVAMDQSDIDKLLASFE